MVDTWIFSTRGSHVSSLLVVRVIRGSLQQRVWCGRWRQKQFHGARRVTWRSLSVFSGPQTTLLFRTMMRDSCLFVLLWGSSKCLQYRSLVVVTIITIYAPWLGTYFDYRVVTPLKADTHARTHTHTHTLSLYLGSNCKIIVILNIHSSVLLFCFVSSYPGVSASRSDVLAVLGYYAAYVGNYWRFGTIYRSHLQGWVTPQRH